MKKIMLIVGIVITIIVCFIVSFIIGVQMLNTSENSVEQIEENEDFGKNQVQASEANSKESTVIEGDMEATKNNFFEGIIVEVDIAQKEIVVENPSHLVHHEMYHADREWRDNHMVIIGEEKYVKAGYLLCLDNVPIKDSNGNKIGVRDLKVGDTIKVKTRNVEYVTKIIFEALTSDKIVSIERKGKK